VSQLLQTGYTLVAGGGLHLIRNRQTSLRAGGVESRYCNFMTDLGSIWDKITVKNECCLRLIHSA
jgi:hypothetical protein